MCHQCTIHVCICAQPTAALVVPPPCPTCGHPLFDLDTSVLFDWIQRLQTDLDNMKRCLEEVLL